MSEVQVVLLRHTIVVHSIHFYTERRGTQATPQWQSTGTRHSRASGRALVPTVVVWVFVLDVLIARSRREKMYRYV